MGFPILVRWHLCIESGPWFNFGSGNGLVSPISTYHQQDSMALIWGYSHKITQDTKQTNTSENYILKKHPDLPGYNEKSLGADSRAVAERPITNHGDVIWYETHSALLTIVSGIHRSMGIPTEKGQWYGTTIISSSAATTFHEIFT